jgi:hypothetical protein
VWDHFRTFDTVTAVCGWFNSFLHEIVSIYSRALRASGLFEAARCRQDLNHPHTAVCGILKLDQHHQLHLLLIEETSNMRTIFIGLVVLFAAATALAQSGGSTKGFGGEVYTPDKGSPERKAILDALRVPVEKKLKQPVVFKIDHFKVQNGWAFLLAAPQRPDGGAIDYRDTVYQEAVDAGAFDNGVVALVHNMNGKWKLVQYVIGATDVPYVDWDKTYRAPRGIFPFD